MPQGSRQDTESQRRDPKEEHYPVHASKSANRPGTDLALNYFNYRALHARALRFEAACHYGRTRSGRITAGGDGIVYAFPALVFRFLENAPSDRWHAAHPAPLAHATAVVAGPGKPANLATLHRPCATPVRRFRHEERRYPRRGRRGCFLQESPSADRVLDQFDNLATHVGSLLFYQAERLHGLRSAIISEIANPKEVAVRIVPAHRTVSTRSPALNAYGAGKRAPELISRHNSSSTPINRPSRASVRNERISPPSALKQRHRTTSPRLSVRRTTRPRAAISPTLTGSTLARSQLLRCDAAIAISTAMSRIPVAPRANVERDTCLGLFKLQGRIADGWIAELSHGRRYWFQTRR